ncbi:unnamed protein product [Amoebophrya sp. A25]|nr:unnamed protein product [Amoebophrya sp. A25]|eukprot:GSA25T00005403001.1
MQHFHELFILTAADSVRATANDRRSTPWSDVMAYGTVVETNVMRSPDQYTGQPRSRGFGFVTFDNVGSVDNLVGPGVFQVRLNVDGKDCDIKRIDEQRGNDAGKNEVEERKVFVGGLPDTCDGPTLRNYFAQFDASVQEARVMTDPTTGKSRCFGYVTFSDKSCVALVLSKKAEHYINEKWIDVKECQTKGGKGGMQMGKGGLASSRRAVFKVDSSRATNRLTSSQCKAISNRLTSSPLRHTSSRNQVTSSRSRDTNSRRDSTSSQCRSNISSRASTSSPHHSRVISSQHSTSRQLRSKHTRPRRSNNTRSRRPHTSNPLQQIRTPSRPINSRRSSSNSNSVRGPTKYKNGTLVLAKE